MYTLNDIYNHIDKEYPKEACGLIVLKGDEEFWVPCKNNASNPEEEFEFDSVEYISAVIAYDSIKTVVHSHPNTYPAVASKHDIKACNFLKIPYLIITWPEKDLLYINPGDEDG